jgi:hypothetical protein
VRGFAPGGFKNISGVLTLAIWLYGTLVLAERQSGYVIMLLGSILGAVVPIATRGEPGLWAAGLSTPAGSSFGSSHSWLSA